MSSSFKIEYFPAESIELSQLTYVIIGARENEKWIFVRHSDRNSWELPAGHIEKGETATQAAHRELFEETGTTEARIEPLFDYSVSNNGQTLYGRIFYSEVIKRDVLPDFEIAEIRITEKSPEPATYPEAHWNFIEVLEKHLEK